ncbi:tetratricopeptide repeat-containing sensor histidine kinase [Fluviicola taffensis]|nr:histidine kinase [Fluviicola taffensis]
MMRTLHLFICLFFMHVCATNCLAGNTIQKVEWALKNHLQKDSIRCELLKQRIEMEPDDRVWPKFNDELISIVSRKLKSKQLSKKGRFFYQETYCIAKNNQAYLLMSQGEAKKAYPLLKKTIKIAEKNHLNQACVYLYSSLANYYEIIGDYDGLINYAKKALEFAEKINDPEQISTLTANLSYSLGLFERNEEARYYLLKSIAVAKKHKRYGVLSHDYYLLAVEECEHGNISKSIECGLLSLKYSKKSHSRDNELAAYRHLGTLYNKFDELDKAEEYLKKSLYLARKMNVKEEISHSYINLSNVYLKQVERAKTASEKAKLLDRIEAYLLKALDITKRSQLKEVHAYALYKYAMFQLHQATLAKKSTNPESAQKYREASKKNYLESLVLSEELDDEQMICETHNQLAAIYLNENNLQQAVFHGTKSYALLGSIEDQPETVMSIATTLKKIFQAQKNFKLAFEMGQLEHRMSNKVFNLENKTKVVKADFKIQQQVREAQIDLLKQKNELVSLQSERKNLYLVVFVVGFLFIGLVALFLFIRFKQRKKTELLAQKMADAELIFEQKQRASESEIKAIKSQMNPHFFYNALNSIQGYVLTGEQQKASESIGLFSELSRSVLESSRTNEIALYDELELLESYLKLECMRMPKIRYEIEYSADLRLYDLFLPPMIVQPIVENSVKHGLANKENGGLITLRFVSEENTLRIEIEDDGIGREAAGKIGSMKPRKGSSFSTEANMTRIELLNESYGLAITQEILDKEDEHGNSLGTLIILVIPQDTY